jgi:hypothetical protein
MIVFHLAWHVFSDKLRGYVGAGGSSRTWEGIFLAYGSIGRRPVNLRITRRTNAMMLDYVTVDALRTLHPAWRLLRSDHAALIASFLHRVFVAPNVRMMAAADLTEALEDELYGLREKLGAEAFPKPAMDYLNEWASTETAR